MGSFNLFKHATDYQTFKAGTLILQEQERYGEEMYIVKQGEVDIFLGQHLIETIGEEEPLGEMAMIEPQGIRSATAIAKTDCQLVPINQKRFMFLVQENPYFALELMKVLVRRLRKVDEIIKQTMN
ncbi:MAG: cyclic nucleotide-binding domain-containing protein [Synechococcaceae cyanobacterium RL_1_2]|nr:cyclic nucleotide-binding domain-containing protein [Synechococcaceae cyanobacterium RL_1_2]